MRTTIATFASPKRRSMRHLDTDPLTTPLGEIDVLRNQIAVNSTETFLQDQADVTIRFDTGSLRHTLVTGAEGGRETSSPYRQRYDLTTVPETSLLHPDTSEPFAGIVPEHRHHRHQRDRDQCGRVCARHGQSAAEARLDRRSTRGPLRRHGQPILAGDPHRHSSGSTSCRAGVARWSISRWPGQASTSTTERRSIRRRKRCR